MLSLLKRVRPVLGLATAAGTVAAGAAPVVAPMMAGAADSNGHTLVLDALEPADGTYESCSAYFGFGKNEATAVDVVSFDVADQNGSDPTTHSVQDDTQVVFVLENTDGATLECAPEEITEAAWDAGIVSSDFEPLDSDPRFAWPGPGHFAYPSVIYDPMIDGFGQVTDVGFKVVGIPNGHDLVAPSGLVPLTQHYPMDASASLPTVDDRVLDLIEAEVGATARAAFEAALAACDADFSIPIDADAVAAVQALFAYEVPDSDPPSSVDCGNVFISNSTSSFMLGLQASMDYVEPISLAVPTVDPETTTTTTTPVDVEAEAEAADPVTASPDYTG